MEERKKIYKVLLRKTELVTVSVVASSESEAAEIALEKEKRGEAESYEDKNTEILFATS